MYALNPSGGKPLTLGTRSAARTASGTAIQQRRRYPVLKTRHAMVAREMLPDAYSHLKPAAEGPPRIQFSSPMKADLENLP